MPDDAREWTVSVVERLAEVPRDAWNACAASTNPFVSYDFLSCLEDSGCVGPGTGWAARHVVVKTLDGAVLGCAPTYLKSHSMGEYVFDQGWAQAFERAGGHYYPKLLTAVPFTPATGPRLLVRGDLPANQQSALKRQLADTLAALTQSAGLSSAHVNFVEPDDAHALLEAGFLARAGIQYHWKNNEFESFDDFLETGLDMHKLDLRFLQNLLHYYYKQQLLCLLQNIPFRLKYLRLCLRFYLRVKESCLY